MTDKSNSILSDIDSVSLWDRFIEIKNRGPVVPVAIFALSWLLFWKRSHLLPSTCKRFIARSYNPSFTNKEPIHDVSLPAGLSNLRNTCYLNSILQSLFALKSFRNLLLVENMFAFEKDSFGEELQKLFVKMAEVSKGSSGGMFSRSVTPLALAKKLNLDISTQEDAQECLLQVIKSLHDNFRITNNNHNNRHHVGHIDSLLPCEIMKINLQQIIYCHGGLSDHGQYHRMHRHIASLKVSCEYTLSLSIQHMNTLHEALSNHFTPESLHDTNNLYYCNTHGYVPTTTCLTLTNFPSVLIIHLKRFLHNPITKQSCKLHHPVDIPLTLDLRKYCTNSYVARTGAEGGRYALTALVIHQGSIEQGHYFTLAKLDSTNDNANGQCEGRDQPGQWVQCNDHQVSRMSEQAVLKLAKGEEEEYHHHSINYDADDDDDLLNQIKEESFVMSSSSSCNAYLLFYVAQ